MKILIVQIGRYGDLILTTPLVSALLSKYPGADIDILASEYNAQLRYSIQGVHSWLVYKKAPLHILKLIATLSCRNYNVLVDPKDHASRESRMIARCTRAPIKIGFNDNKTHTYTHSVRSFLEHDTEQRHIIERNLSALESGGLNGKQTSLPVLSSSNDSTFYVDEWLSLGKEQKRIAVLSISAGEDHRMWKNGSWVKIVHHFERSSFSVVILHAAAQKNDAMTIAQQTNATVFPSRSINDAVALIERASIVVTVDSAPVHIASSFNVPCVALYDSTHWNRIKYAPRSDWNRMVIPKDGLHFIADIDPADVITAIDEFHDSTSSA